MSKTVDSAPSDDQGAEVERLIDLGATRTDVGQPADAPWVVLADPEGNEFCVLPSRRP
ncbi:VOC family protein [Spirillospora sp. NBC_01491]|uniref:VOC family protein n=1 Tax=Spirillospora sp. NBC_01491 TaxID=2976007 RepID=UPI003FA701F0